MGTDPNREHFDRLASNYEAGAVQRSSLNERIHAHVSPLVSDKIVLDVGNGGFFAYDPTHAHSVTVLDVSPAMLDRIDDPRIHRVLGDAKDLAAIEPESVDVVLFVLSLHHITGKTRKKTIETLDQVLTASCSRLQPGGQLVLVEPVVSRWLYALESLLYPLTRRLLGIFGVPMIFFHTRALLEAHLREGFQPEVGGFEAVELVVEEPMDPLEGSFPGLIRVSPRLLPTAYWMFRIRKPSR